MDAATPWRAQLITELAFLSLGDDQPFAPGWHGPRGSRRDPSSIGQLLSLWGIADARLDMALVAVSLAFPERAAAVTPRK